jgi:ectoine hydroxylase-related dioxygenase (phytanoyl-CoA dioxygenase family)
MAKVGAAQDLTGEQVRHYHEQGFLLVPGLVTAEECEELIERSLALHARGSIPGCFSSVPAEEAGGDVLKTWPRMMHPHRVDELSLHFLRHPRVVDALEAILGRGAIGLQTMLYWKPPGAKGQDFHQDDYYLRTEPDACIAAWLALEEIDEGNGALIVFPGSHREPILPMTPTDTTQSFTSTAVTPPPGYAPLQVTMHAGDVLFFHGRLIHGSRPNRSPDRFRKSFICHYVPADTASYNHGYDPSVPLR